MKKFAPCALKILLTIEPYEGWNKKGCFKLTRGDANPTCPTWVRILAAFPGKGLNGGIVNFNRERCGSERCAGVLE